MQCTRQLLKPASSAPKTCTRKMTKPRSIHNEDSKETRAKSSESNNQFFIINADSVVSKRQPEVQSSKILADNRTMDLKFIDIHMSQWNSNLALQNSISEIRPELGPISEHFNKPSIAEGPTLLKTAR